MVWWLGWLLPLAVRAYELIETNYGDDCTRRAYNCPEFQACCTNRTKHAAKTRYNCMEAMDGRLMIYECVGSIRRRPSVPASLQQACAVAAEDYSQACIRESYGCWDFRHCCRLKGGGQARTYCSEVHKDLIDDFLCCSADSVASLALLKGPSLLILLPPLGHCLFRLRTLLRL